MSILSKQYSTLNRTCLHVLEYMSRSLYLSSLTSITFIYIPINCARHMALVFHRNYSRSDIRKLIYAHICQENYSVFLQEHSITSY